ncbi:Hint domain-containing protein [Epibacterium ulvae]|uniref:Hint domain-containing protein n=1 Tax=Epibacterium ulvae TaxID=1156985 RepID=UPI001BFC52D4|nr:Hint domain-containing protein [Epibacterium ulvae]MBT8152589.1 Hint domain-containing protein [Epibacterium ulvae]
MATTFQVIYLGNLPDIDSDEGNWIAESADDLVGLEFGSVNEPLAGSTATWSQVGGSDNTYDMNNDSDSDQFSINGGDAQTFDGIAVYNATITYTDGTTENITASVAQDANGESYLTPEFYDNADQAALEAKMIQSISLDSVAGDNHVGLISSRIDMELVTCFTTGSRIRAELGIIPIEHLTLGDRVMTLDHGLQSIRWIGRSTVAAHGALAPIQFAPGTVGNSRPLRVSPQHRMLVEGGVLELYLGEAQALIPACHMVNDRDITRAPGGTVTYYHLMFDCHEMIWAEGALSESFYPGEQGIGALSPAAQREIQTLFPDLARQSPQAAYGPLARPQLPKQVWHALQ